LAFDPKDWRNTSDGGTPLSAAALIDLEERLAGYTDETLEREADTSIIADATLSSGASAGATSISASATHSAGFVVIDPFTTSAELRKITSVSGSTVNFATALANAHPSGAKVYFFESYFVPALWFGAVGNGSTDDHTALQWAERETVRAGLCLEGQNRTFIVTQPLLFGPSFAASRLNVTAKSTFAPADSNGAMCMNYQGNVLAFTGAAGTDVITTPSNHGIPADGVPVVFQGGALPGGLTAGRIYYAYNRTATTFKVAATRGGGTIDLTSDGAGTVFCEVQSLQKLYLRDCYLNANSVAGLRGAFFNLQQPSFLDKVRIDNAPREGLRLSGQHAELENFESIGCEVAVALDSAQFMLFTGTFNAEQCNKAVWTVPSASSLLATPSSSSVCSWDLVHVEMNSGSGRSTSSSVVFDIEGDAHQFRWELVHLGLSVAGQTGWHIHTGAATTSDYSIGVVRLANASADYKAIYDEDRGITRLAFTDYHGSKQGLDAPQVPSSFLYTDPYQFEVLGMDGRVEAWGGNRESVATRTSKPGSTQTGDQYQAQTSGGVRASGFSAGGYPFTMVHSAPADAAVSNGQVMWWLDQTAGTPVVNFKGKDSGGTVFTHSLPASAPILKSLLTTKGDLIAATGSATPARLPVGSDGQVLKADSAQSTGLAWSTLGTIDAANLAAVYRTIFLANGRATTAAASGTKYGMVPKNTNLSSFTEGSFDNPLVLKRLTAADFSLSGATAKLRLVVNLVAGTAPAITITAGLYPWSNSGGTYTLGTVVSGSTVAFATPGGLAMATANSGDFDFPADGYYVIGYTVSGTPSGNFSMHSELQLRHV
jgi:hypothetical protein